MQKLQFCSSNKLVFYYITNLTNLTFLICVIVSSPQIAKNTIKPILTRYCILQHKHKKACFINETPCKSEILLRNWFETRPKPFSPCLLPNVKIFEIKPFPNFQVLLKSEDQFNGKPNFLIQKNLVMKRMNVMIFHSV